jgi:hypothetical protein
MLFFEKNIQFFEKNIQFFEKNRKKFYYTSCTFLTIAFGSKRPLLRYNMTIDHE